MIAFARSNCYHMLAMIISTLIVLDPAAVYSQTQGPLVPTQSFGFALCCIAHSEVLTEVATAAADCDRPS